MSLVQFGPATVNADIDSGNRAVLDTVYSSGYVATPHSAVFKGYPLSLYYAGPGAYSLAVIVDNTYTFASPPATLAWRSQQWALASSGNKQCFGIRPQGESVVRDHTVMFRGMPLAVTNKGSLIMTQVSGLTIDQEEQAFLGTNTVTVRRSGKKWYLVVAEV